MLDLEDLNDNSWTVLPQDLTDPQFVSGHQIVSGGITEPYACILKSGDGSAHLIIAADEPLAEPLVNPEVAGLRVRLIHSFLVVGRDPQTYIDVRCEHQSDIHPFTIIVREIAELVLRFRVSPSRAVNSTVRLWRRFWRRPPSRVLEEWEQIGLIAELCFLRHLLEIRNPGAVNAWTGPLSERHDFTLDWATFEAKATTDHRRRHQINGIYQLEPSPGRRLGIVSMLFARAAEQGTSLADQVAKTLCAVEAAGDDTDVFWERLAMTGYSPEHTDHYAGMRYTFTPALVFPVGADFPGITRGRFAEPLSPRVGAVTYLLDIDGLPCFGLDAPDFVTLISGV